MIVSTLLNHAFVEPNANSLLCFVGGLFAPTLNDDSCTMEQSFPLVGIDVTPTTRLYLEATESTLSAAEWFKLRPTCKLVGVVAKDPKTQTALSQYVIQVSDVVVERDAVGKPIRVVVDASTTLPMVDGGTIRGYVVATLPTRKRGLHVDGDVLRLFSERGTRKTVQAVHLHKATTPIHVDRIVLQPVVGTSALMVQLPADTNLCHVYCNGVKLAFGVEIFASADGIRLATPTAYGDVFDVVTVREQNNVRCDTRRDVGIIPINDPAHAVSWPLGLNRGSASAPNVTQDVAKLLMVYVKGLYQIEGQDFIVKDNKVVLLHTLPEDATIEVYEYSFSVVATGVRRGDYVHVAEEVISPTMGPYEVVDEASQRVIKRLPLWDPKSGYHHWEVDRCVDVLSPHDPAQYNRVYVPEEMRDEHAWKDDHVGQIWWDVATLDYLPYTNVELFSTEAEQITAWGARPDYSGVRLYQWRDIGVLPELWAGDTEYAPKFSTYVRYREPVFVGPAVKHKQSNGSPVLGAPINASAFAEVPASSAVLSVAAITSPAIGAAVGSKSVARVTIASSLSIAHVLRLQVDGPDSSLVECPTNISISGGLASFDVAMTLVNKLTPGDVINVALRVTSVDVAAQPITARISYVVK